MHMHMRHWNAWAQFGLVQAGQVTGQCWTTSDINSDPILHRGSVNERALPCMGHAEKERHSTRCQRALTALTNQNQQ